MHPAFRIAFCLVLIFTAACGQKAPAPGPAPDRTAFSAYLPQISRPMPDETASIQGAYPPSTTPQIDHITVYHHSGQSFITWPERSDLANEIYRVYRSSALIDEKSLLQARLLAQIGKGSARIWGNYYAGDTAWGPRLADRFIIQDGAGQLQNGAGALVWTLAAEDLDGKAAGSGYYAVTVTPAGGRETLAGENISGPVQEAVGRPAPVEITYSPGINAAAGPGGHFYLQYMDLRHYNPTFHTPNATNEFYGFDPKQNNFSNTLAYTYDYYVFEPTPELCGGKVPDALPVLVFLHGARSNRYPVYKKYAYPHCAYGVYPIDQTETWYFGFARSHDYRQNTPFEPGDVIENYTEQRVLRMLADLMRDPPGPAVDPQRIYLAGHSMGGTGALAFAERYPNVFAAVYSGQPVTNFRATPGFTEPWPANLATKWGAQDLNLPVAIDAPNGWAAHLQKYNGVGVFDWEDLRAPFDPQAKVNRSGDEMAPFGVDHGTVDEAVLFPTQGQALYAALSGSPRAWAGAITETEHLWSYFGWPLAGLANLKAVEKEPENSSEPTPDPLILREPFWGLQVIRDETVPGLSNLSGNGPTTFNQTILWSASWNAWDGAPADRPDRWQMSLCAISADFAAAEVHTGLPRCGTGKTQTVDIAPRRLQQFRISPGRQYDWENRQISNGRVIAKGTLTAGPNGVITIPGVQVSPRGNRISIQPHP